MDTDSFVHLIETWDFYKEITKYVRKKFATSKYLKDNNKHYQKKRITKFKARWKMNLLEKSWQSFQHWGQKSVKRVRLSDKRCKGTKRCVVAEFSTFDDGKTCLFDGQKIYRGQMLFENKKHEVCTVNKREVAANKDNDKRRVQANGIKMLARGYIGPKNLS